MFCLDLSGQSTSGTGESESPELAAIIIPGGSTYLSRYNLRTYVNNSYSGLRYLEISGQLDRIAGEYQGNFWKVSETTRDLRAVVAGIDAADRYRFSLDELTYAERPLTGSYPEHLYRFPEYRNFPVLPPSLLESLTGSGIPEPGSSYQALGYRLVDPDDDGNFTPVQIVVRYIYRGTGVYLGENVHLVDADFALRSDGRLTGFAVQGRNEVSIAIFPGPEPRIFMNNTIVEQYGLPGGRQIRLEGFGLTWIRSPEPVFTDPAFLRGLIAAGDESGPASDPSGPALAANPAGPDEPSGPPASSPASEQAPTEPGTGDEVSEPSLTLPPNLPSRLPGAGGDIEVVADPLGLALNLPNVQFRPDSTDMLPGERARIARLIEILKEAGERRFLVVGHSADVGNPVGQLNLSRERARVVGEMLAEAGIPPGTIRFEGRGATDPVGDNSTPEGRAQNRRVEVIILD